MRWPKSVSCGFTTVIMALTVLTVGPKVSSATPIPYATTGIMFGTNSASLVAVTTNNPCISFAGASTCQAGSTGYDITPPGAIGDPIFQSAGDPNGQIKDIGTAFPITAFKTADLTIGGGPAIFDLVNIVTPTGYAACTFTTAAGSCSTGTFILSQNANSVGIQLTVNEFGYLGSIASGATPYEGSSRLRLSVALPRTAVSLPALKPARLRLPTSCFSKRHPAKQMPRDWEQLAKAEPSDLAGQCKSPPPAPPFLSRRPLS